jgi:hypothetical protein
MSPSPHRKRWDKDRIVTDLAREDSDDDVINPKPDSVEIVRTQAPKMLEEVVVDDDEVIDTT